VELAPVAVLLLRHAGGCIQEDVGVEAPFVPSGFVVPLALATEQSRLQPLGPQLNDSDYEAWSSSVEHIHNTPGWETSSWPDDRSVVDNLIDVQLWRAVTDWLADEWPLERVAYAERADGA
jgi:hypothetical protein